MNQFADLIKIRTKFGFLGQKFEYLIINGETDLGIESWDFISEYLVGSRLMFFSLVFIKWNMRFF